jgi:leucyl aminopeptidase
MALKVTVRKGSIAQHKDEMIVVNLLEGVKAPGGATRAADDSLGGLITRMIKAGDITGKYREASVLPGAGEGSPRVLVMGLGPAEKLDAEVVRNVSAAAALKARELGLRTFSSVVHGAGAGSMEPREAAAAMVEGAVMGVYTYTRFKSKGKGKGKGKGKDVREVEKARLPAGMTLVEFDGKKVAAIRSGVEEAQVVAGAVNRVRDLATTPANALTPADLASHVHREVIRLKKGGVRDLRFRVLKEEDMRREGMGGILGVSRGSVEPARLILLEYNMKRKGHPLVFVGKGITFDSGGISLKPTEGTFPMWEMKDDMTGAAVVLSAVLAAAELGVPRRLVAIAPCAENLPSGRALKPGDVIRACDGTTIEVHNTDAEGRLVLADGLAYSKKYGPEALVDIATLTGSVWVALGSQAAGVMGSDQPLIDGVRAAGEGTGERWWQFPMYEEYDKQIESDVADVRNVGGRAAGAITAGAFLRKFVPEGVPWAHLDIAGVSWNRGGPAVPDKSHTPKGSTGFGVRTLLRLARDWRPVVEKGKASRKGKAGTKRKAPVKKGGGKKR